MSVLKEPTYVTSRSYWPSLLIAISYIPITGCPLTILATLLLDVVENNRELYQDADQGRFIPKTRLSTYLNIILGFLKKVLIPSVNMRLSGVFRKPPPLSFFRVPLQSRSFLDSPGNITHKLISSIILRL